MKVTKINNGWGGKRTSSKAREPRNTVLDLIERSAGDWIPVGETEMEIPDSPEFFYISEMLGDGFSIEEILAPEDMYPAMYKRIKGGENA